MPAWVAPHGADPDVCPEFARFDEPEGDVAQLDVSASRPAEVVETSIDGAGHGVIRGAQSG